MGESLDRRDRLRLRAMSEADIPSGMRLKTQAGWNQTQEDWRRFLQMQPDGCFVAEWDGHPVGTTTTCVFGAIGWIAMVLVDIEHRHQGIGTRLVRHALEFLDGRGVATVRLDATALGRPVYERLGFVAQYDLMRMTGVPHGGPALPAGCRPADLPALLAIVALDQRATGTPREELLTRLLSENPLRCWVSGPPGDLEGYLIARPGSQAVQIGPMVARTESSGVALLDRAIHDVAGQRVYVDVPCDNRAAVRWTEQRGLCCQRSFTRMVRGRPIADDLRLLWTSSGPEKG